MKAMGPLFLAILLDLLGFGSVLRGPKGNLEHFVLARRDAA